MRTTIFSTPILTPMLRIISVIILKIFVLNIKIETTYRRTIALDPVGSYRHRPRYST